MTPDQIDISLGELSNQLERLRSLYEQYFMGIERIEPAVARKALERQVQELRKTRFPTTAKRFKFQTLIQRYNSLQQYWNRTCRDIENGTYRKHRQKAARRFGEQAASSDEVQERAGAAESAKDQTAADLAALLDSNGDLDSEMGDALAALSPRSPTPPQRVSPGVARLAPLPKPLGIAGPPPVKKLPSLTKDPQDKEAQRTSPKPLGLASIKKTPPNAGLSEARLRAIHANYCAAREKTQASAISFEKLSKSIRDTEKKLLQKSKGRNIDFDVSIKGGKAILKPKLK